MRLVINTTDFLFFPCVHKDLCEEVTPAKETKRGRGREEVKKDTDGRGKGKTEAKCL